MPRQLNACSNAVSQISVWASRNGFMLAPEKTLGCIFRKGRNHPAPPNITLLDHTIEFRSCVKFLGIIFDRKLKWQEHVESLRSRCLLAMNALKATAHLSWGGDRCTLLRLYRALIRSKIDYGSQFYGNASKSTLRRLDTIHNSGIRLALGAFRSSPIASLHAESGEPPLYHRRNQICLQHYARLQRDPRSPTASVILNDAEDFVFDGKLSPLGTRCRSLLASLNIDIS